MREIAKGVIVVTAALIAMTAFLYVAQPGFMGDGMFEPSLLGLSIPDVMLLGGFGGALFGLGWMIRIYRADPEPDEPTWRYRDL